MIFQIGYSGTYGGGGFFANIIYFMQNYGILDVLLPFALIFGIIYAVLQKWGPFKEDSKYKKTNILIAGSISILAIVPHIIGGAFDIVAVINRALPEVGLLLLAIVLLLIVTGIAGKPTVPGKESWISNIAPWIAMIFLVLIFWRAIFPGMAFTNWLWWLDTGVTDLVIALVVMGLIIWLIVGRDE